MSEKLKWVVQWDAGMVGTDCVDSYYGTKSKEEIENEFHPNVIDWFDSFGHDDLRELDEEDEEEDFAFQAALEERKSELSAYAEIYDPYTHDGLLATGQKWAWE